jgi:putative DNA-invertase from lambdoid prophage Rac
MATVFYARVSGEDQTLAHQLPQARAAGFAIDEAVADEVSGVTTRLDERPQGRRLFDMLRAGDTLVVRWVDRLGRNYEDVTETMRCFLQRGVVIRTVIGNLTFDGTLTDPVLKALRDAQIAIFAALGQAQAEATKEAQRAGIAHARASDPAAYLGRKPSYTKAQLDDVLLQLPVNASDLAIGRALGLSRETVRRIRADPAAAAQRVTQWAAKAG